MNHYYHHPFMPEKAYDPHYYHHSYGHHHVSSSNLRSYPQASNFRNVQRAAGNEFARHDMGFGGSANGPNSSYSNGAHDTSIYAQQHSYSPYDPYKMGHNMSANNYYSTYSYNNFESSSSPMYRSRANGYAMRDAQQFYNQYGGNHHRNDYPANGMMSSRSSADYYSNGQSNNNGQIIDANHHYHSYSMNGAYNDYSQNLSAGNQYAAASGFGMGSVIGQQYPTKESKTPKPHRDKSLSKLVAMNRRLESQMSESERISTPYNESFEYFTDYSETPDSMTCSQYASNDSINDHKRSLKAPNGSNSFQNFSNNVNNGNQPVSSGSVDSIASSELSNIPDECNSSSLNNESNSQSDANGAVNDDLPANQISKSPIKSKPHKKSKPNVTSLDKVPVKRRRRRREKKSSNISNENNNELKANIIPLPGFQQAFGSTEIGRFSEIFFNTSDSPIESNAFESEVDFLDTLSPQPWETGDSLEGPHFSLQSNDTALTPAYAESLGSTDSPTASNNSYFSELRISEF